jgi:hypothetical protein
MISCSFRLPAVSPCFLIFALGMSAATAAVPETSEARMALSEVIFAPVGQAALIRQKTVLQKESRDSVFFQSSTQADSLYLIFPPPGIRDASSARAGGYIIKRSLKDGQFLWLKIFVQNDPGSYARLAPMGANPAEGRTRMDIYIDGAVFQQGVTIAQPFERLLTAPFAAIVDQTEGLVDWSLVLPPQRTSGDAGMEKIVQAVRSRLKGLRDAEDGAMGSDGKLVFIANGEPQADGGLNCSGFAKFVIDGFYTPIMGRLTDISALKQRSLEARGNRWSDALEIAKDPYFGLDWSRNLARELAAARTKGPLPSPEFADVRSVERFEYIEDVGYPMEYLKEVLYILARRNPGYLYLGSLNREADDGSPVRQHHHLAVFFPYVDAKGVFRIVVMERNLETSVASLKDRYPKDSVHLVRISVEGDFKLP